MLCLLKRIMVARHIANGVIRAPLVVASLAAGAIALASCIVVPLPKFSPQLDNEAVESIRPGISRAEVLMSLGNPDLATHDYGYLGYQWYETKIDWFWAFGGMYGGWSGRIEGSRPEHLLMLEFGADGRVTRIREFEGKAPVYLRDDVKKWIQTAAKRGQ